MYIVNCVILTAAGMLLLFGLARSPDRVKVPAGNVAVLPQSVRLPRPKDKQWYPSHHFKRRR